MGTDATYAEHVLDLVRGAGAVAVRKMFGEYALYCDGKVVALLCDNQFFLKPLSEVLAMIEAPAYGLPYPGAKPHLLLTGELDDPDLLLRLVRRVAELVPAPKPKKPKAAKKV